MMYGVPNMKADKIDVVERRARLLEEEGITFICGKDGNVGGEGGPSAQDLMDYNDAVLLATGATVGRDVDGLPGREFKGIHLAMEFLHSHSKAILDSSANGAGETNWREKAESSGNKPPIDVKGKNVVVVGGGDTGSDCIGTSVRQGAASITNLVKYPKGPADRPPHTPWPHAPEIWTNDSSQEEAAVILNGGKDIRSYSVMTKEFVGDADGHVCGVKIVDTEWKSKDGRMQMVEVAGSDKVIPAEAVFLAIGFVSPEGPLAKQFGVQLDKRGNYKAPWDKEETDFQTSSAKVFAAGDCRRGQSLVVWAIAEGRQASKAIHKYIMENPEKPASFEPNRRRTFSQRLLDEMSQ
jgi:glutamate synthase (NADPH/NADH)